MKSVLLLLISFGPAFLLGQQDPAFEAYKTWDQQQSRLDYKARAKSLFDASAEWVAKWPDSRLAWEQRRTSLLSTQNQFPELWNQVGENLIRLSPPHTRATGIAYDWVTARVNVKEAESLLLSEIEWQDSQDRPAMPESPSLAFLIDDVNFVSRSYFPLCDLASAQIQMKEFDRAHKTISRMHNWLETDFRQHYDQDPLETFPDYESKYYIRSAELARAEGRRADALAFYRQVSVDEDRTKLAAFMKREGLHVSR